jgi:hypothetical protein
VAEVELDDTTLTVKIEGWDRVWALRSQLTIPLEHVQGAREDPEVKLSWKMLKVAGTHLPGVIAAGSFYEKGGLVFWDVHDEEQTVVIDLTDERYKRLVIQVDDPTETVTRIQDALSRRVRVG